jgi:hypothetical protein
VNLKGHFLVTKAVVPHMKEKGYGKIVFISSMGAVHPSVSVLAYHAAKAGIIGLTLNLAFELARFNIYVNCIVPGPIETPFWNPLSEGMSAKEKQAFFKALAEKEVPLGRRGKAEDIAGPALFLASGLSDYVTGQILYVDTTEINSTGVELVRVPGTYDIFSTLITIRDTLENQNGLSEAQLQECLNSSLSSLEEVNSLLLQTQVSVGSKLGFLGNLKDSLNNLKYNAEDETTRLQEADIAQIAIDLSQRELLYQMSLSVAAKIMSMSLLDFIQ